MHEAHRVDTIPAVHSRLKHSLINLVTSKQFFGFEKEDPHAHIQYFNKITSTLKYKDVPETSIKLMLFHFLSMLSASVKFKVVEEFCVTCAVLILYDSVPATDWGDLKVITTRSGISYDGPPIPPPFLLFLWWWNGNPVVDIGYGATAAYVNILTSDTIQKLREKDDILASKFVEIFKELHFELSFADALLHMPKFASMFKRTEIGEILNLLIDDPTELELHGNYRSHLEYERF
ncbi:hypothetical protein Tco_0607732 [Tanacetum coccineum]